MNIKKYLTKENVKKHLTKKNIIVFTILIVVILLIVYLAFNTAIFKTKGNIQDDLVSMQEEISSIKTINNNSDKQNIVDNSIYSNDVGVSNETLYIKENASNKIKDSIEGTDIGHENTIKSENGMIVLEPYQNTEAIEYKILSHTKEEIEMQIFDYNNLCREIYVAGSVTDKGQVENGENEIIPTIVAPNQTYTLINSTFGGVNTVFFFDGEMKYISSTEEKTFKTPENCKYIKIITENPEISDGYEVQYNLVLGEKESFVFGTEFTQLNFNVNSENNNYLPFTSSKSVIYIDGAEIELKYVAK